MGAFPERYGLEMLSNPSGLLEDQAFNEAGGLPWARKKRQIIHSTEVVTEAIKRIKKDPKYWSGAIDLELLFWLYERLGHDNKKDIVRCYEDAFIGSPAHPKSYAPAMEKLLSNGNGITDRLAEAGMRAKPEEIRVVQETLHLPVEIEEQRVELEFRVLGLGASPTLVSGRNLGTSVVMDTGFADALAEAIQPGSRLDQAVTKAGCRIVRDVSQRSGGGGFRLEWKGGAALDIQVSPMGAGERAFVDHEGLGVTYSVPHDCEDPTRHPRVLPFVEKIATFIVRSLAGDPRAAHTKAIDMQALRAFATSTIEELEAAYASELDFEPLHEMAQLGRRHGDKYSKVAVA